jgi:predicted ribosome quality control (RQC) complex YloA/Tae2 family protein
VGQAALHSLTAPELAAAVDALQTLVGATVLDAVPWRLPAGLDDLVLVLAAPGADPDRPAKHFLHVALGGGRARITTTQRRPTRDERATGPHAERLRRELEQATLAAVEHPPGERRVTLRFSAVAGERRLEVELFSARGLWALCDADGTVLHLSRAIETAVRTLRQGDRYAAPPPLATPPAEPPSRFPRQPFDGDVLAAIDELFFDADERANRTAAIADLQRLGERALQRARQKLDALDRQLADEGRSSELRRTADLMLAYGHTVRRGAEQMLVPDPDGDGEATLTIPLDPSRPVAAQAKALYDKARRLDDGRVMLAGRRDTAAAELATLAGLEPQWRACTPATDAAALDALQQALRALGALPKAKPQAGGTKKAKAEQAPSFRRFVSAEGYPIYVGRNNRENDELTMRFANGNDLWLHVGGGRPGSHVVVRLPRDKTASLETLLDAGTLAVHFSKARGERRLDVVYTHKKHVKKPKGLPPGAVVPSQTKTITVQLDEERLRRLLQSQQGAD